MLLCIARLLGMEDESMNGQLQTQHHHVPPQQTDAEDEGNIACAKMLDRRLGRRHPERPTPSHDDIDPARALRDCLEEVGDNTLIRTVACSSNHLYKTWSEPRQTNKSELLN